MPDSCKGGDKEASWGKVHHIEGDRIPLRMDYCTGNGGKSKYMVLCIVCMVVNTVWGIYREGNVDCIF